MLLFIVSENIYNEDIFKGGGNADGINLKDILMYNKNHTWEEVGQMQVARSVHVASVLEDVSNLCP